MVNLIVNELQVPAARARRLATHSRAQRLLGQMGNRRVTVQNLKIALVDAERNLLAIKGTVPGSRGSLVLVREAVKKAKA